MKDETYRFYVDGDPNRVVVLRATWLRQQVGYWLSSSDEGKKLHNQPARARVQGFFKHHHLVPVDSSIVDDLMADTSDYHQFFTRARSLGAEMSLAGVPASVVERALDEMAKEAGHHGT